jgi:hypothetical protein
MLSRILIVITSLIFSFPVAAQVPKSQVWNWGWNESTHELVAYSENGDSNRLLTDVTQPIDAFWRISEDRSIALIRVSNQLLLYSIGIQSAQKLSTEINSQIFEPFVSRHNGLGLEAYHYPYLIVSAWYPIDNKKPSKPAFLINLSANTVEYLSDSVALGSCCRFTSDGHNLRYVTSDGGYDAETITLHERSLDTGVEQTLYQLSGSVSSVGSDKNGELWLFGQNENDLNEYHLFHVSSGVDEVIYKRNPNDYYSNYQFMDNDLISYQPLCETNCVMQVQTADGNRLLYPLPDTHGGAGIYSFYWSSNNSLIIGRLSDYWLLTVDHPPQFMGYVYADGVGPVSSSFDGRFDVISDSETYPQKRRTVIDWKNLETLITVTDNPETVFEIEYNNEGFILNSIDNDMAMMYLYATHKAIKLSNELHGKFFDLLPDDSVLFTTTTSKNPQIIRYFPQTDKSALVVEGLLIIPTIDVTDYTYPQLLHQ